MAKSNPAKPKRASRLGRGLSSLMAKPVAVEPPVEVEPVAEVAPVAEAVASDARPMPERVAEPATDASVAAESASDAESPSDAGGIVYLAVDAIQPNRHQPRQNFAPGALQQLADSIRAEGLIQPIVVRPLPESIGGITHELVAGERRWRAAQLAELKQLPAIVRELDDRQLAEWALIENLQREDLNPIERAEAFQRLIELFGLSHEQVAARVGVERSTVSNLLRLLNLEEPVRQLVRDGRLSMGQARALAGVSDGKLQLSLAMQAIKGEWSVRKLEQAARQAAVVEGVTPAATPVKPRATYLRDLEEQIGQQLHTKVRIRPGRKKGSGTLAIDFYSLDQFDNILAALGVETN